MTKITAWSQSRKGVYDECPQKAKFKFIDKLPDPGGPALDRGLKIHKLAEQYIMGTLDTVPQDLVKVTDTLSWLRGQYEEGNCFVEQELAFDAKWNPVDWFHPAAWLRVKADVVVVEGDVATIIDWKTGKYKPDGEFSDQLNLYAVALLSKNKDMARAEGQLIFTDHTEIPVRRPEGVLERADLPAALKKWERAVARMLADEKFAPTPGAACRWCPYSKSKGGPCAF